MFWSFDILPVCGVFLCFNKKIFALKMQIVFNPSVLFFHAVFFSLEATLKSQLTLKRELSLSPGYSSSPARPVKPRGEQGEHLLLIQQVWHHWSHQGVKYSGALQTQRLLSRNIEGYGKYKKDFC